MFRGITWIKLSKVNIKENIFVLMDGWMDCWMGGKRGSWWSGGWIRYSEISRFTHHLISDSADSYDTVIILLFDILPCRTRVIYNDLGFTELKKCVMIWFIYSQWKKINVTTNQMNYKLEFGARGTKQWPWTLTMLLLTRARVQASLMKSPSVPAYTRLNGATCNYTINEIHYAIQNTQVYIN